MLTLLTYPAGFGTLSVSPFCVKAMYLLNAAHAAWPREDTTDPRRMPRTKLPVLRTHDGLVLDRWERPEVWPVIRDTYFAEIPRMIRGWITGGIRRAVLNGLRAQGLGRLTWDERMARADQDLAVISGQLGNRAFLFGETPTLADISVVPMLDAMRATPVDTPLTRRLGGDAQLAAYVDRGHAAMAPA